MMRLFAVCLLIGGTIPCLSSAQTCNCPENFTWLTEKIRINYPGYSDKVTEETRADLDRHTERYARLAQEAPADTACFRLLSEWAAWFNDQHIYLSMDVPEEKPEDIRRRFAAWESIPMTEAEARTYLDTETRHPLEGIWQNAGGSYRVAIVRRPTETRDFAAVVLRADSIWWMPGQVKFELKERDGDFSVNYFMRDHSPEKDEAVLREHSLVLAELGDWYRLYPGQGQLPPQTPRSMYTLTQLDAQTLYLRMPTMNDAYRAEFKQLVKDNESLLANTPHLIVDLRGNGGGSDITYFPLRPYLYTDPVTVDAIEIYLTEDNIDKFRQLRKNKNIGWLNRRYYGWLARKLSRQPGPFYARGKDCKGVIELKKTSPNPRAVAMLIDRGCGSSCEQLVLFAQQSDKVTLMGQNTAGVLDYANVHTLSFPSGGLRLHYPTSRSCRVSDGRGVDNVGIPPEIRITEGTTDWVAFAKRYLEEQ